MHSFRDLASQDCIHPLTDEAPELELPFATFVRMERIFELAVFRSVEQTCCKLSAELSCYRYGLPDRSVYLFVDTLYKQPRPDVIVCAGRQPILLVDAKYREVDDEESVDDLYQLLAHCRAFGVKRGWLVGITDTGKTHARSLGTTADGVQVAVLPVRPSEMQALINRTLSKELTGLGWVSDLAEKAR